jgi:hypothetical protein
LLIALRILALGKGTRAAVLAVHLHAEHSQAGYRLPDVTAVRGTARTLCEEKAGGEERFSAA